MTCHMGDRDASSCTPLPGPHESGHNDWLKMPEIAENVNKNGNQEIEYRSYVRKWPAHRLIRAIRGLGGRSRVFHGVNLDPYPQVAINNY